MFDFEKLEVYNKLHDVNVKVLKFLNKDKKIDAYLKDQWKRASVSALLNLSEGSGRMSKQDKRHFYTMARGSVFECVSVLLLLRDMEYLDKEFYEEIYGGYETCSKMLLAMYRSMSES
jgi:four helix bundle protein